MDSKDNKSSEARKEALYKLKQRQGLTLDLKEQLTQKRIREWYNHFSGNVSVSFSGGKDSTVLLHQVRRLYPEVPAVFVDTGLEYPEIKDFVRTIDNVRWMKPKMAFHKVLKEYGYPVISKRQARYIRDLQNASDNNKATTNLRLTGYNRKGEYLPSMKISKKWIKMVDSGFKISGKCCDVMKKEPFHRYLKETGRYPMTAVMACESTMREKDYLKSGCNAFHTKSKDTRISKPMAFWMEEDIWEYIKVHDIPYSKIYDMGEKRTGCMFCMFGVHLEKGENRFQRMKKSHPKQYDLCINKLGCGKVLDFIGVSY